MATEDTIDFAGSRPGGRRRAVTAFFDDRAAAQAAVDDIIGAGIARSRVTLVEGGPAPLAHEAVPSDHKGLWQTVKDLFMADEDRHAYGEGLRRGGFLVSVDTAEMDHDRVVELLDRDGAVDIDARAADWTLEGWDPARAAADLRPSGAIGPAFCRDETHAATPGSPAMAADRPDAAETAPSVPVGPAFGEGRPRPASPTPRAEDVAAGRIEPELREPSATLGPASGDGRSRPAAAGPNAIRDPGAASSRLRTYIDAHVRHDPDDAPR